MSYIVKRTELVLDLSPQLGADLDANGFNILFDDATGINDDSDNEQLVFQKTASAVNHIEITNAATGNSPSIAAVGDNADIHFNVVPKGTGVLQINGVQIASTDLSDSGSFMFNLVEDTTPQLGGDLDLNGNGITAVGPVTITTTEMSYLDGVTSSIQSQINAKIANVVEDIAPQLGGNLDTNLKSIVTVDDRDLSITPDGLGSVILDGIKYPQADGTAGQSLQTDGLGQLSFVDRSKYNEMIFDAAMMVGGADIANGATSATSQYDSSKGSDHWLFDGAASENVQIRVCFMPSDWDTSTTFKVKLSWDAAAGASAADGVVWGIKAVVFRNGDAIDNTWGAEVTIADTVTAVGDNHITAATAAITPGGTVGANAQMWINIARKVADGSDDMTEDAKLMGVILQYQTITTEPAAF